ncbi:lens fiber major intrinsic protein [Pleomassaria siparia CBS 279.74]|uniref:Lens fiber major intrinsic protein n=1 Tax=Pleomassaria siparia CBS 279.74 TaxID=1314801 RepID=A0A6G1KCP4_9PLEO|nr:lens fiber major intrinsic protein [Pleomassaria siparia CBS 279.74]
MCTTLCDNDSFETMMQFTSRSCCLMFAYGNPPTASRRPELLSERHNFIRKELSVFLGELTGTFMFLSMGFAGTQLANESAARSNPLLPAGATSSTLPDLTKLIYISFTFATALTANAAIFSDISGAMFNPAVTAALWTVGQIRWVRALHSVFAQIIAGVMAAGLISVLFPGPLPVATSLDASVSITRGLFVEMFFTSQLILAVLMVPASPSKPMYIGATLFIIQLSSVFLTGGSVNPTRSFGPAVFVGFDTYHWIYWLGPMLGAGLGSGVFALINSVQDGKL